LPNSPKRIYVKRTTKGAKNAGASAIMDTVDYGRARVMILTCSKSTTGSIGIITLGLKLIGKSIAGNPCAAFDKMADGNAAIVEYEPSGQSKELVGKQMYAPVLRAY